MLPLALTRNGQKNQEGSSGVISTLGGANLRADDLLMRKISILVGGRNRFE